MPRARLATGAAPPEERLRGREIGRSLFWLVCARAENPVNLLTPPVQVGLPYLRAKAQDYFEELGGGIDSDILDQNDAYRQARALSSEASCLHYASGN
jgi:hypothetical protein